MPRLKPLRKCPLFADLSFRDLSILAHHFQEKKALPNQWIAKEGELSGGLVILASGKMELRTGEDSSTLQLEAWDFFGELSLVEKSTRGIGAKCVEPADYLLLTPEDFRSLEKHEPEVAGRVVQGVARSVSSKVKAAQSLVRSVLENGGKGEES